MRGHSHDHGHSASHSHDHKRGHGTGWWARLLAVIFAVIGVWLGFPQADAIVGLVPAAYPGSHNPSHN